MKKKFVEAPEIEKEVKRLLRVDNEAIDVKWDLVTEEELNAGTGKGVGAVGAGAAPGGGASANAATAAGGGTGDGVVGADSVQNLQNVDETDLFGGNVTDSDEEEEERDSSRVDIDIDSEGDSNLFGAAAGVPKHSSEPSSSMTAPSSSSAAAPGPTSFTKDMFPPQASSVQPPPPPPSSLPQSTSARSEALKTEMAQLTTKKQELERNIANCDNQALLMRFQQSLADVVAEIMAKEAELNAM